MNLLQARKLVGAGVQGERLRDQRLRLAGCCPGECAFDPRLPVHQFSAMLFASEQAVLHFAFFFVFCRCKNRSFKVFSHAAPTVWLRMHNSEPGTQISNF